MALERLRSKRHLPTAAFMVAAAISATATADAEAVDRVQRYCNTSWNNARIANQDWTDCTQQTVVELLDRLPKGGLHEAVENRESEARRELNRAIWRTVQRWRRRPKNSALPESDAALAIRDAETRLEHAEDAARLETALEVVTPRQQRILRLWSEGHRVAEIAAKLDLPTSRVSDEKYKALQKLRAHFGVAPAS